MAAEPVSGDGPSGPDTAADELEPGIYLIDKSAWAQRRHHPEANERINRLATLGRAATCLVAALEYLYPARNRADFDDQREALDLLEWLPATAEVESTAVEIMATLARKAQHRMPVPDLMIAATALVHDAAVLHYDRDFERIADVTELRHEWIVPPGTGHGRAPG
jgi:hypothetical protein